MALWGKDKPPDGDVVPAQSAETPTTQEHEMSADEETPTVHNPKVQELTHRLPIRPDYDAEFSLPRDLTADEVKRIAKWLEALAMPPPVIPLPPMPPIKSYGSPPPGPQGVQGTTGASVVK